MITCDFDEKKNQAMLDWCDVLVIGPGLGTGAQSRERAQWFLAKAAECKKNSNSGCRWPESSVSP